MARPPNVDAPQKLLDAAGDEFALHGVDSARVEDIARRAGFSKAAFYLYWDSKEKVFEALVAELFDAFESAGEAHEVEIRALNTRGLTTAHTPAFQSELQALQTAHTARMLEVMWEKRRLLSFVLDEATGPRRAIVEQFVEVSRRALTSKLESAAQLGAIRIDADLDLASDMIHGMFLQLGRRMTQRAEPPDFYHWARFTEDFLNEGLRRRPSAAEQK